MRYGERTRNERRNGGSLLLLWDECVKFEEYCLMVLDDCVSVGWFEGVSCWFMLVHAFLGLAG
jgi:hypothetical protein